MQPTNVRAFKRELENYNFYHTRVKALDELIEYCYHMLGGYKGLDPSKEPIHNAVPNKDVEYKIRDEIERHTQNKARTQAKIDSIDEILAKLDNERREQIMAVYVDGKTMETTARKYYVSTSTLEYQINQALAKALKD